MYIYVCVCVFEGCVCARACLWHVRESENERESWKILFGFIKLTQVHNNTVSAQDIFIFGRISIVSVFFAEIKQ